MPIFPLPLFEADLEADRKLYNEQLKAPKSMVVRFGVMKYIGEYPYDGDAKPGCGSKLVCKTHRGTEIAVMLTSTCPNAGCQHSVTRREMLGYIENSGGKDYPFFTDGRVLRVATMEDISQQAALDATRHGMIKQAAEVVKRLGMDIKVVDAEPILGSERLTFYFGSEDRVDFRGLVMELAALHHTRIELRQIGARDEARVSADYEKCGQHCCCKQFLKVLKPVSMRNAKIQKATLDPLKISGRCGRLMCCLRYEESTYDELRANLPKKKTTVLTPDGPGIVIDTQILTQLVLVRLDGKDEDAAYPVETLKKLAADVAAGVVTPKGGGDDDVDGLSDGATPASVARQPAQQQQQRPTGGPGQGQGGQGGQPGKPPRQVDRGPRDGRDQRGGGPREQGPRDQAPVDTAQRDQSQANQSPTNQSQANQSQANPAPRGDRPPPRSFAGPNQRRPGGQGGPSGQGGQGGQGAQGGQGDLRDQPRGGQPQGREPSQPPVPLQPANQTDYEREQARKLIPKSEFAPERPRRGPDDVGGSASPASPTTPPTQ